MQYYGKISYMNSQYFSSITGLIAVAKDSTFRLRIERIFEELEYFFNWKLVGQRVFKDIKELEEFQGVVRVEMAGEYRKENGGALTTSPRLEEIRADPRYKFIFKEMQLEQDLSMADNTLHEIDFLLHEWIRLMKQKISWDEGELELRVAEYLIRQGVNPENIIKEFQSILRRQRRIQNEQEGKFIERYRTHLDKPEEKAHVIKFPDPKKLR